MCVTLHRSFPTAVRLLASRAGDHVGGRHARSAGGVRADRCDHRRPGRRTRGAGRTRGRRSGAEPRAADRHDGRRAGRGRALPPRLVVGPRRRPKGGCGQRRRSRGDGRTRLLPRRRVLGAGVTRGVLGPRVGRGARRGGPRRRHQPGRRGRDRGQGHHDRGHGVGRPGRAFAGAPVGGCTRSDRGDLRPDRLGRRRPGGPGPRLPVAAGGCGGASGAAGAVRRRGGCGGRRSHGHDRRLRRTAGRSGPCGKGVRSSDRHRPRPASRSPSRCRPWPPRPGPTRTRWS